MYLREKYDIIFQNKHRITDKEIQWLIRNIIEEDYELDEEEIEKLLNM